MPLLSPPTGVTDHRDASNATMCSRLSGPRASGRPDGVAMGASGDPEQSRQPVIHSLWLPLGSGSLSCCLS